MHFHTTSIFCFMIRFASAQPRFFVASIKTVKAENIPMNQDRKSRELDKPEFINKYTLRQAAKFE